MEPRTSRNNRMERSRHVEDVSSSDEPDLKRPVSDNSASTTRKRESILKNVMVLFSCDVRKRDGKVYMPNTIEMARLKRLERGQFKTNIEFIKTMTEKDVKEKLRRHFSILGNNGRLSCATAADNRTRLEFHCTPQTVWDGNNINRHIRGNSALYVLCEGTPESVSERPESSTVDSFLQQLQTTTPEPIGSPLAYSGKLKSLKRKHNSSSSSVLEVRRYIESNNSSDSAFESTIADASGVDDNTEHSIGKIEEAACSHIAQLERYLQNSEMDPSEGSSWEEIDLNRRAAGDQICLSDRELNEAYQDVQEMFSPVIKLLCPDEGPITGGTKFLVCLNARRIPENLTSLRALFKGVGFADLTLVTEGVYTGRSPASKILGKVAVTVGSLDGTWNTLDETEFEYHPNVTQELQKLISKMPGTERNIPLDYQTLNPACSAGTVSSRSSFSPEVDRPLMADESKDILSLKALQCILFAAAATNDRECIEIIFSTSAGEAVFQTYRNSSILPEDTARAKGHQNLAKYLQNVHKRLSREIVCDVQNVTIDWLELKRATAKKDIFSGTNESQGLELEMENDDDQSSYFADDEASICQSPSTTDFSNEDECIESKYRELSSNQEVKDSTLEEIMNVSSRVNQEGTSPGVTISQVSVNATVPVAGEILNSTVGAFEGVVRCKAVLHNQKPFCFTITAPLSEDTGTVQRLNSPFIQKNVENGKTAQEGTSKSREEPHDAVTNVALHLNQEGTDPAEDDFVSSAVITVAGETSNAIELSTEGGTDRSVERQNQEPTDRMTIVFPCEINTGTLMGPYIQTTTKDTFWKRCYDETDQKEEQDDLEKPLCFNQEGAGTYEHIVTSAVTTIAGETPNSFERGSEVGNNSSALRPIHGPIGGITEVLPCGDNVERVASPFIMMKMENTRRERNCGGKDQEEELNSLYKPPDEELDIKVEAEECKPKGTNMQTTTIATDSEGCQEVVSQRASDMLPTEGSVSYSEAVDPQALRERVICAIAMNYLKTTPPQSIEGHNEFEKYMRKMKVNITGVSKGSLAINQSINQSFI